MDKIKAQISKLEDKAVEDTQSTKMKKELEEVRIS